MGYTSQHLHQRADEHGGKIAIDIHMRTRGSEISSLSNLFSILGKCKNKWYCLMFEGLLIREGLKATLNKKKKDSISSKLI